jgi:putative transposase
MKNRKRNRMVGYDYSQNNLYFVTSCVKNMECCFGDVVRVGTGRDLSVHNPDINNPDINNPDINNPDINNPDIHNPDINEAEMILNEYGIIANNQLEWLEIQYPYIELHSYKVMPNHIHAVIEIDSLKVNSIHKKDADKHNSDSIKIKSLSEIMGAYKTTSSKLIHQADYAAFAWHRSFHDHIIRDEKSYLNIVNYIENNPNSWNKDKFYKK